MRVCQLAIQHRFRDENVSEQSVSSGKRVTDLTHRDIPPFNAISFQMSALFIRIPFCLFASADAERRLLPRGSERRVICSQEPLLHKTLSISPKSPVCSIRSEWLNVISQCSGLNTPSIQCDCMKVFSLDLLPEHKQEIVVSIASFNPYSILQIKPIGDVPTTTSSS